ncbi:MAG: hypothetical protein Q9M91_02190 [Candidatus Dojkabacteria bacterium]|nr:hypothetical protein [Candidatus Dojkabacteria bacterium]MDQ7020634.1 hypothetical protein [Candidatus Dojkabacteria bacterium]
MKGEECTGFCFSTCSYKRSLQQIKEGDVKTNERLTALISKVNTGGCPYQQEIKDLLDMVEDGSIPFLEAIESAESFGLEEGIRIEEGELSEM